MHNSVPQAGKSPNVFSIPFGSRFLPNLVSALAEGRLIRGYTPADNPLLLADSTIYVPNRRTSRELGTAFLEYFEGRAGLLPSIRTLGDAEGDEFGLVSTFTELAEVPETIGSLDRKLELSRLVQKWVETLSSETRRLYGEEDIFIPSSQADAIYLSDQLGLLLDQITREEKDWTAIEEAVPHEHAQWWNLTAAFLQIIFSHWPENLRERGLIDPAAQSRMLLQRRIEYYRKNGSVGPVIVAGSTGSVPSSQRLLQAISELPNGAIVLPGLDKSMPQAQWNRLQEDHTNSTTESHPQFAMARLLRELKVSPDNVRELGAPSATLRARGQLVGLCMALPRFTAGWRAGVSAHSPQKIEQAFSRVCLVEAANERQEAVAIALALRETLETPEHTAALVTPDRNLAQRVSIELQRFGITVDDTAGQSLSGSAAGRFARQVIDVCFLEADNIRLASLMKSNPVRLGTSQSISRKLAETIETRMLRRSVSRPQPGSLADWIESMAQSITGQGEGSPVHPTDQHSLATHALAMDKALAPLCDLSVADEARPLGEYTNALVSTLQQLCTDDNGDMSLTSCQGWTELEKLFAEIGTGDARWYQVLPADFPSVFAAIIAPTTVREPVYNHARLHIYGPLEIRLLDHDRVVVAGLNEGTWPRSTHSDAFLNRAMRLQLGMASPERAIGLSAHDFQQVMGKAEVILSRSVRVDRAPAIASRWIQRLLAVLGEDVEQQIRKRGERFIELATRLETVLQPRRRAERPEPKPPLAARPTELPVTDIERWIRDPYALYAKRILKLRPIDPMERSPDALLKGTLYHQIMEEYVRLTQQDKPEALRLESLLAIANEHIRAENLPTEVTALWLSRFEDIAEHYIAWETGYLSSDVPERSLVEIPGSKDYLAGAFRLHARADRIDILADNSLVVIDYKTGSNPTLLQARSLSPQLALEGAIAASGGFKGIGSQGVTGLKFIRLRDAKAFKVQDLHDAKHGIEDIIGQAETNLGELIRYYQDPDTGYLSRRAPFKESEMSDDYDHLARTREWSFGEGEGDD